jgi:hypothetical protein
MSEAAPGPDDVSRPGAGPLRRPYGLSGATPGAPTSRSADPEGQVKKFSTWSRDYLAQRTGQLTESTHDVPLAVVAQQLRAPLAVDPLTRIGLADEAAVGCHQFIEMTLVAFDHPRHTADKIVKSRQIPRDKFDTGSSRGDTQQLLIRDVRRGLAQSILGVRPQLVGRGESML